MLKFIFDIKRSTVHTVTVKKIFIFVRCGVRIANKYEDFLNSLLTSRMLNITKRLLNMTGPQNIIVFDGTVL